MVAQSFVLAVITAGHASSLSLNVRTKDSTISAASTLAANLIAYYSDGGSDGVMPLGKVNWWESAKSWNGLIQHWYYTGDSQYNDEVPAGICAQAGDCRNSSGRNTLGNDDQLWWALTAMTAAETNLSACTSGTRWLDYAQTVYNDVVLRWNTRTCEGGLRWQISPSADGYDYKNSITNGLFFQLAARLARYTGDNGHSSQAETIWDWTRSVGLINEGSYAVWDGTTPSEACSSLTTDEWSYNLGVYLYGVAVMLDYTKDNATWSPHLNGLINAAIAGFTDSNGTLQKVNASLTTRATQISSPSRPTWRAGRPSLPRLCHRLLGKSHRSFKRLCRRARIRQHWARQWHFWLQADHGDL